MLFSCSRVPAVPVLVPSRSMALFLTTFQESIFLMKCHLKKKKVYLLVKLQGREEVVGKLCGVCVYMCVLGCVCINTLSVTHVNYLQDLPRQRKPEYCTSIHTVHVYECTYLIFRYNSCLNTQLKRNMYNNLLTSPVWYFYSLCCKTITSI